MDNKLMTFENAAFGKIRTLTIDGEPWFVAVDVCRALEIGNPTDAMRRLDADERTLVSIEGASNGLPVNAVNEPGLYTLILGSRKPEAKVFKRWITHEVIPAIRKYGGYMTKSLLEQVLENPNREIDEDIIKLENEDIVGLARATGMTMEELAQYLMHIKSDGSLFCSTQKEDMENAPEEN